MNSAAAQKSPEAFSRYQKWVVAILAGLQFTIVLDFMLLAPLGASVIPTLHITTAQFGWVVSAYAFSAGVSGLLTAGFADRFDRKKLLLVFYSGFVAGTLLCGLAPGYHWLLFARMVTGLFAGVVGAVSFAIVTDLFPLAMRGRVMGVIQTAFAASSVLGIPISLLLANRWSWNTPFLMLAGVGALVGALIQVNLRPVDAHLRDHPDRSPLHHLWKTVSNGFYLQGFATTGLLSLGGFMLMPFMSVFIVNNVGLPIDKLPLLYVITGLFSIVSGPLIGRASDALGKFKVFAFGGAVTIVMVVIYTHLRASPLWAIAVVLVVLQVGIFSRMISASALLSAVPQPSDRGSYMSIGASIQQMAGGVAAVIAGLIVVQTPAGMVLHYDTVGYLLACTTLVSLALVYRIDRIVAGSTPESALQTQAAAVLE